MHNEFMSTRGAQIDIFCNNCFAADMEKAISEMIKRKKK
jgi:hypothetical protein